MGIISARLRASARGQVCTLQIPGVCNHDPETTVLAHLPSNTKGMGNKGHDFHAVFACSACHAAMDNHEVRDLARYQLEALEKTIAFWIFEGDLIIASINDRPRRRNPKSLPPKPLYK